METRPPSPSTAEAERARASAAGPSPERSHCATCGHALTGLPSTAPCPECGGRERCEAFTLPTHTRLLRLALIVGATLATILAIVGLVTRNPLGVAWITAPALGAAALVWTAVRAPFVRAETMVGAGSAIGFAVGVFVTLWSAAIVWHFDIGSTATGSSTAGLLWLAVPIVATLVGAFGAVIGFVGGGVCSSRLR